MACPEPRERIPTSFIDAFDIRNTHDHRRIHSDYTKKEIEIISELTKKHKSRRLDSPTDTAGQLAYRKSEEKD